MSELGVKDTWPIQVAVRNGLTLSNLVASGCDKTVTLLYGSVIKSPVFW